MRPWSRGSRRSSRPDWPRSSRGSKSPDTRRVGTNLEFDLEVGARARNYVGRSRSCFPKPEIRTGAASRVSPQGRAGRRASLSITVLAYEAARALRRKLKADGVNDSWLSVRATLSVQRRITASFTRRDGRTVHIRKTMQPEPKLAKLYITLGLLPDFGGIRKSIHDPRKNTLSCQKRIFPDTRNPQDCLRPCSIPAEGP